MTVQITLVCYEGLVNIVDVNDLAVKSIHGGRNCRPLDRYYIDIEFEHTRTVQWQTRCLIHETK